MSGLFLGRFTPKIFPFVERGEAPTHPPIAVKRRGFFRYRYFVDKYQFHCSEPVIEPVFLRRDYAYRDIVLPSSGESIVEGGGYYGETALWFSDAVGPAGHVWSFEPDAHSYRMLCENMARNRLKNVTPVPVGLWDTEGQIGFRPQASASRAAEGDCAKPVPVITLDRLVERERLEKVDYIKLDIEGAERRALLGMEHTIRYFRPKLAICVYHLFDDIIAIPRLVKELCPDYVLYLDHKSDTLSETVLFALPRTRAELSGGA
jgi:FkbM family methyltransferase